jgi:hypothetical protein
MPHKPNIHVVRGPRWNSVTGWFDWSIYVRWWECVDDEAIGHGDTQKEAYDNWYKNILRPYQNGPEFMAAYKLNQTPTELRK